MPSPGLAAFPSGAGDAPQRITHDPAAGESGEPALHVWLYTDVTSARRAAIIASPNAI